MDDGPSPNPFLEGLSDGPKQPRRLTAFHMYFKLYYHSRVKTEYQRRYKLEQEAYQSLSEEEKKSNDPPSSVHVRWKVGREFWERESPALREEVTKAAQERHEQELKDWRENLQPPESPEDFHK